MTAPLRTLLPYLLCAFALNFRAYAETKTDEKPRTPPNIKTLSQYEIGRRARGEKYLNLQDEEKKRWVLNLHCLAIEKDGIAIEPYAYAHEGPPGLFPYWKIRSCESLQDRDYLMGHDASQHFGNKNNRPDDKPNADGLYFPLRDLIAPAILEAAEARNPSTQQKLFPKGLLIYVHGGNNLIAGAIDKCEKLIDPICDDGYYPLFVCWNSELLNSWWEEARYIRNGVDTRGNDAASAFSAVTTPIYLGSDLATAVARAPRTILDNLYSAGKGHAVGLKSDELYPTVQAAQYRYAVLRKRMKSVHGAAAQGELADWFDQTSENDQLRQDRMVQMYDPGDGIEKTGRPSQFKSAADKNWQKWQAKHENALPLLVSQGDRKSTATDEISRIIGFPLGIGGKALISGLLEGGGEGMWNMMSRRTRTMFYNTNSFQPGHRAKYDEYDPEFWDSNSTGIGGFAVFLRKLEQRGRQLEVTAVGHSMGSMVMNEAVRRFPNVNYKRFVYMAPACSIRDFNDSVVAYLRSSKGKETDCFNLCLNPRAENLERSLDGGRNPLVGATLGEIVPRGSLLVWIDDWFNHPQSFPDRTLGQFENAMLASKMFHPDVQSRIHMLAFGLNPGPRPGDDNDPGPQEHADFSGYTFWKKEFYLLPADASRGVYKLLGSDLHVNPKANSSHPSRLPVR